MSVDAPGEAALRQQLADATRHAEGLHRIIEAISGELELEPLLTRLVEYAAELIGARYGTIGLVERRGHGLVARTAAIYNMPPEELGAEMAPGAGLAGHVLRDQRPLRLDRYGDLDQPTLPDLAEHAVVGVPIWWAGQMIGFFGIGAEPPRRFDTRDCETLELLARHAAVAIQNAQLFEAQKRRVARVTAINRISRLIASSLSLHDIFRTTVEAIHEHLGFAYIAAGILDPDDPEQLILLADTGDYAAAVPAGYRLSIHYGLVGAAARTGQRVLVNDVAADPRYLPLTGGPLVRAELAVPIAKDGRALGVLNVESNQTIGEEDAEGIEIIADQLGIAIDNARLLSSTQRALEEQQLLYQTSRHISTAMSIAEVVAAYLEQVAARGRYSCTVALYEFNQAGDREAVVVRGFWSAQAGLQLTNQRIVYTRDGLDPPLDQGQTVLIADVASDPRASEALRAMQQREGRPALAMIPLMVRGQRIGLVILSYGAVHQWSEADLRPYQATAAQLALAIDSRHQHLLLSERGQQLAVLEERRRLARELHDSVTQSLFSMSLLAQVVPDLWEIDQAEARGALGQIRDLTRGALAEMRALLFELRPAAMGEQELARALQHHAEVFERRSGVGVAMDIELSAALPAPVEEGLFRIAQEALANVARHAQARRVRLSLRGTRPVRLTVADDGRGFVPHAVPEDHFGLVSMRERAASIGAYLQIHSAVGQGTSIVVEWPRRDA